MAASREELESWFQGFDKDGSGKIDANELRSVVKEYREWQNLPTDDAAVDADVGDSPAMHVRNFCNRKLLRIYRVPNEFMQLKGILAAADTSGDGKIDKTEFFNFFASS